MKIQLSGAVQEKNVSLQFSDNEFNNGSAKYLSFTPGSPVSSSGGSSVGVTIAAASNMQPGTYIAAATVTNGSIYRSVYFTVVVT
jgi:hypothetical protein